MVTANSDPQGFEPVVRVALLLSGLRADWMIVGGWAVDLFLGYPTRAHDDVDIGVARGQQLAVRRFLDGWHYEKVVPRGTDLVREPWREGEWLDLPVHEVHAHSPTHGRVEFLLLERDADEWVYRRDSRVRLPWGLLSFKSRLGITALAPEVALLFKAKGSRDRDQADFETLLARMSSKRREWLRAALEIAHPGHRWLGSLARARSPVRRTPGSGQA